MAQEQLYFRFNPDGRTFELTDRFMLEELIWIQRHLKLDVTEMGAGTQTFVGMFMVLRRTDKNKWNFQEFQKLSTDDLEVLDPEEEEAPPARDGAPLDPTGESEPGQRGEESRTN